MCRRALAWSCITALGLTATCVVLLDSVSPVLPLREGASCACVLLVCVAGVSWLGLQVLVIVLRAPGATSVALAVEQAHPEFLDALVCATEIEAVDPERRGVIERALLADIYERTRTFDFLATIFPPRYHAGRLALLALLFSAIAALSLRGELVLKAACRLRDLVDGRATGLYVNPGDGEVPEHADVRITADVRRWENLASIRYEDSGRRHSFVMNRGEGERHAFTLYDVTGTLRYRVFTPSLVSPWYTIRTYRPPAVRSVEMCVTPPSYTGRQHLIYQDLRDGSAVAGSRLTLTVDVDPGTQVAQKTAEGSTAFLNTAPGRCRLEQTLDCELSFRLRLRNTDGRVAETPEVTIRIEPDLPPVVEVLQPRKDVKRLATGMVQLEARASDDFGVARIAVHFSVSGGPYEELPLLRATGGKPADGGSAPKLDETVHHTFDVRAMQLKEGDVVAYFVSATDNREPEAQQARSDVYFIEIRPEIKPEDAAAGGQQMKMDVSGLIAELKRLIRLTWDVLGTVPEKRARLEEELRRGVRDLKLETERKINEMREAAGGGADSLMTLLQSAADDIERAEVLLGRRLVEESLSPQGQALAKFIAVENELLKNAAKGKQGEDTEGEEGKGKQETERQPTSSDRKQTLADLKRLLEKLRQLTGRQSRLNDRISREVPDAGGEERGPALAQKQRDLRESTEPVHSELSQLTEAREAARGADAALREMDAAEGQLQQGGVKAGGQHGKRAHSFLLAAARSLEEAYRRASANEIQRLAAVAQGLADAQRSESETSRSLEQAAAVDRETAKQAREQQQQLQAGSQQLETDIDRASAELEDTYPDASRALAAAAREARQQNLDGTMTRAANALLYRRFAKARKHQVDSANTLQQLASQLAGAAQHLPAMSREELMEALNQLRQNAKRVREIAQQDSKTDAAKRLDKVQEQSSRQVDRLALALQDPAMQRVGDELAMPTGSDDVGESSHRLLGLLKAAAAVVEKHLLAGEMARRFTLSRRTSVPPEKYRRLVERYFKDLSRTK